MPIICLDLDDTIADSASTIIKYAQKCDIEMFGGDGKLKELNNNPDHFYFARMLNWNTDQLITFFDNYYIQYLKVIKPKQDASLITHKLKQMGFKIYIITARVEKENNIVEKITNKWLIDNKICFDKLVVNQSDKGDYINKVSANYFIDDSLEHCISAYYHSPITKIYLMENKFNEGLKYNNIERVSSLSELYDKILLDMKGDN